MLFGDYIGFMSLPDELILRVFDYLQCGSRRVGSSPHQEDRQPRGVAGIRTGGRSGRIESDCRALASTCVRLRNIFRHKVVSRVETSEVAIRPFLEQMDLKSAREGTVAGQSSFMAGIYTVLKRYAPGIQDLALVPEMVLYIRAREDPAFEFCHSSNINKDVKSTWTLRTMFPNLKKLRLRVRQYQRLEPYCEQWVCADSPIADTMQEVRRSMENTHQVVPLDLEHLLIESSEKPDSTDMTLRTACADVLRKCKCLKSLEIRGHSRNVDLSCICGNSLESMKEFVLHLSEWPLALYEILNKLLSLEKLDLKMYSTHSQTSTNPPVDLGALSEALPITLRSMKFKSRIEATEALPRGCLNMSRFPNLEELLIESAGHHDANVNNLGISALASLVDVRLKVLTLSFTRPVGSEGWTSAYFKCLSEVDHVYITAPVGLLSHFLQFLGETKVPSSADFHFRLIYYNTRGVESASLLDQLKLQVMAAASIASLEFSGPYARRSILSKTLVNRMKSMCPRLGPSFYERKQCIT